MIILLISSQEHYVVLGFYGELNKNYLVYCSVLQESLDDVGTELHEMREELHKLMGVIESKDHAIETLENQLRTSKDQIKYKYV